MLEVVSRDERMAEQLNGGMGTGRLQAAVPGARIASGGGAQLLRGHRRARRALRRPVPQDLLATLESYLANDCNMNATARAIYAHRHTVAYRLQRVRELTELDPMISEDRERLSLGLKAYRIVAPTLPR